ncbi:MAG: hypothetical protein JW889_12735 [Verrucomicrobia bacterium]|nr:hypothetical protein [Verrucomicrobiota bacterium]
MTRFFARFHNLDRRWLYLAMVVILSVPVIIQIPLPPGATSPTTKGLYDLIESCPEDKVILIDSSWDAGSAAENRAQLECVIRHICREKIKFVVTSAGITVFGPEFANQIIEPIAAETGYVYGADWVSLGYKVAPQGSISLLIDGICKDLHSVYPADHRGTPVSELPLMDRVRTHEDFHLVYCVTYQPDNAWISFVKGQFDVPVAYGCMTISAPGYYPFIDSRQLAGMLIGNRGAAEYEELNHKPGLGRILIMATSFGNLMIILAAVVGNMGFYAARALERNARRRAG